MQRSTSHMQVGIFTNEMCINFRIILHKIFDEYVTRMLRNAEEVATSVEELDMLFSKSVCSINMWTPRLRERFRAQVASDHPQITEFYKNAFLMYTEEMFHKSLEEVTVRVDIPSLADMLFTFLKLASNDISVKNGEYNKRMGFTERIIFIEDKIRDMLYELVIQRDSVRSIIRKTVPKPSEQVPVRTMSRPTSVHREEPLLSDEMPLPKRYQVPTGSSKNTSPDHPPVPSLHTGSLNEPALPPHTKPIASSFWEPSQPNVPSVPPPVITNSRFVGPTVHAPRPTPRTVSAADELAAITAELAATTAVSSSVKADSSVANKEKAPATSETSTDVKSPTSDVSSGTKGPTTQAKTTVASSDVSLGTKGPTTQAKTTTGTKGPTLPAKTPTVSATKPTSVVKPDPPSSLGGPPQREPVPSDSHLFSLASKTKAAPPNKPVEPIFELASQFTAKAPAGETMPVPRPLVGSNHGLDSLVDSLGLPPSEQNYANEVREILNKANTNTITPFDSVSNIGAAPPTQRPSTKMVFMPS